MAKIKIYTDGACSNNPGPGGWGVAITGEEEVKDYSGFEVETTNNRMELMAVREAYKILLQNADHYSDMDIELYSDSAYVVNAINNGWLKSWKNNGWTTSSNQRVKNHHLWAELYDLHRRLRDANIKVDIIKVKGHSGDTYNEYVDKLAKSEVMRAREYIIEDESEVN